MDDLGRFIVAWESDGSPGTDNALWSVQAQRFAANGSPLGIQFQVNSYTSKGQYSPSVAVDPAGDFVVSWDSNGSAGPDTNGYSVQAQLFDSAGTTVGAQFQVNSYSTGDQGYSVSRMDDKGNFVISWESYGSAGTDIDYKSIQARRFASSGAPMSGEFQVNTYTNGDQYFAALAVDPLGNYVVAWKSEGSVGSDDDHDSIQAQRYDALFRDGFESGGTARWSQTVPAP